MTGVESGGEGIVGEGIVKTLNVRGAGAWYARGGHK